MRIKGLESQFLIQTQVATCNHTTVKVNDLRSKSSIHDRYFWKFWRCFFSFNLSWIALFCFFNIITKSSSQIWIQMYYGKNFCPRGNVFKKIDYFWNSCFQILVFDKRQMKWLQTRKRKLQEEIPNNLEEIVKELRESCPRLLCWKDVQKILQNSQKNVLASSETCNRGVFRVQSNVKDGGFLWKMVNGFYPLTIFAKKLHHSCLNEF